MKSILLLILLLPSLVVAGDLKVFTTDGCSAFPDGTTKQQSLWVSCCIRHDLAYWQGGTYEERLQADRALRACVTGIGEPEVASIMLAGVRVGGSPYFPTTFRWGYGWPYPRGYDALSREEKQQVKHKLDLFKIILNGISTELK